MKQDKHADPVARRVYGQRKKRKAGFVSTRKMNGVPQSESGLESGMAYAADVDPRVASVGPQPVTFDLNTGNRYPTRDALVEKCKGTGYKPGIYTPDFELGLVSGEKLFVEVKTKDALEKKPEILDLIPIFDDLGFRLIIVTDELLRGPLYQNSKVLRYTPDGLPDQGIIDRIESQLDNPQSFADLEGKSNVERVSVYQLIRSGHLKCDLLGSITGPMTEIEWSGGCKKHLEVLPL